MSRGGRRERWWKERKMSGERRGGGTAKGGMKGEVEGELKGKGGGRNGGKRWRRGGGACRGVVRAPRLCLSRHPSIIPRR